MSQQKQQHYEFSEEQLKKAFEEVDEDGSKFIEYKELKKCMDYLLCDEVDPEVDGADIIDRITEVSKDQDS